MITKLILTFVATMVLYFTYRLLFNNSNRFQLNRIILLTISVFAFTLPFIRINLDSQFQEVISIKEEMNVIFYSDVIIEENPVAENTLSVTDMISYVYIIGVIFFLMKFFYNIVKIYKMKIGKKVEVVDNVNFIYTNESHIPFSFLKNIYIPKDNLDAMIIKHEMSHVRNHHSIDIILMEIMIAFQWFNPFIRMIKKELKNNHEYMADMEAIKNEDDKSNYMMLLLQQCTAGDFSTIANNFSFLLTKKRIRMITRNKKVKGSVIKVLLTLPVFALLILLNTQCGNVKSDDEKQPASTTEVKADEQMGQLLGTVIDRDTEKPISLAKVILEKNGEDLYYTTADKNGKYELTKINAGVYNVKVNYDGYETVTIRGINIPVGKLTFQDFWLKQMQVASQDSIYRVAQEMPQYPGGPNEMMKYMQENIKYPQSAKDKKIEGRVFVTFVVEKDGSITNATVLRGIDEACDAEALRVVASMPKWTPGKQDGETVRTQFTVPIIYKFN